MSGREVNAVPRFAVVGSPGDRRVELFTAAVARQAGAAGAVPCPPPAVIPWTRVLTATGRAADLAIPAGALLRIDSPGDDPVADALLRGPGDPARVGGGARWFAGFTAALGRIRVAAVRAGARLLDEPDETAVMFDKRRCHARLLAAGVPVPAALGAVDSYARLRARMAATGHHRVFVKPAHGSSASGVIALQASGDRLKATTSAVECSGGFRNSLRVRSTTREAEIAALVDALAPDGLHVEAWLPKAALDGRVLDLRVVVVGGVPTHAVVRTSTGPMTNLHLGGLRGDLGRVRERLGPDRWRECLDICARAAACFPGTLAVGVDLLAGAGWRRLAVAEVNAFGDLLPGLTGLPGSGAEGLGTYAAQVRAVLPAPVPAPSR